MAAGVYGPRRETPTPRLRSPSPASRLAWGACLGGPRPRVGSLRARASTAWSRGAGVSPPSAPTGFAGGIGELDHVEHSGAAFGTCCAARGSDRPRPCRRAASARVRLAGRHQRLVARAAPRARPTCPPHAPSGARPSIPRSPRPEAGRRRRRRNPPAGGRSAPKAAKPPGRRPVGAGGGEPPRPEAGRRRRRRNPAEAEGPQPITRTSSPRGPRTSVGRTTTFSPGKAWHS